MPSFWKRRKQQVDTASVRRVSARLSDEKALARLLEHVPEASELRPRLNGNFFARAWHQESGRDFWVTSDGADVACFTISGLTLQQAARVRVRWDALRGRLKLSEEVLADLIAKEIGRSVTLVD